MEDVSHGNKAVKPNNCSSLLYCLISHTPVTAAKAGAGRYKRIVSTERHHIIVNRHRHLFSHNGQSCSTCIRKNYSNMCELDYRPLRNTNTVIQ